MSTTHCSQCGKELPPNIPKGLCPTCALAGALEGEQFKTRLSLPQSFGDYELLEEIARGGMGVVYKAWQKSLGRIVAVKMLSFGSRMSTDSIKRFRVEASSAAALQHPNIVAIHEVGVHHDEHFLVMDFVDGPDLAKVVRNQPLTAKRAATYAQIIAKAIHAAHERGVLHRDLKPSNILLDASDQPRVTDFGLARQLDGDSSLTLSGQVLGSPNYMPPEQAAALHHKVTRRSDVYGLGAILYHLVTGRPPFQGASVTDTVHQVLNNDPAAPRVVNPDTPRDLETICLKCLEKEPERRYATALELSEELGRFLEHKPIHARRISHAEKTMRWCRRQPALAASLAITACVAFAGVAGILWQWNQARENYSRLAISMAESELITQAIHGADKSEIRTGPKTRVDYQVRDTNGKIVTMRLRESTVLRPAKSQATNFSGLNINEGGFTSFQRSSGSSAQVLAGASNREAVLSQELSAVLQYLLASSNAANITAHCFSTQGKLLAIGFANGELQIWDRKGHAVAGPLASPENSALLGLRFTEDDRHLVSLSAKNALTVRETIHWNVKRSRNLTIQAPIIHLQTQ